MDDAGNAAAGAAFQQVLGVLQRLLAPDGCPWDQKQTLQSLKNYLLDESYEILDAIDNNDPDEHKEELGDLLFQIVFQAALREKEGAFSMQDVCLGIAEKMRTRHPHVFSDAKVRDEHEVVQNWEKLKETERAQKGKVRSALEGIPASAPALTYAQKLGEKAATTGFDWPDMAGVQGKISEEQMELEQAIATGNRLLVLHEFGDVLLALTRLASHLKINAEEALRLANKRFAHRFALMQDLAEKEGHVFLQLPLEKKNEYWEQAKKMEQVGVVT